MKKSVLMLTGACALTVLLAGCSPELDQTQLSPEEQAWAENFKANYNGWRAPESVPRSVRRDDLAGYQQSSAPSAAKGDSSAVPPAVDQPSALPMVEVQSAPAGAPASAAVPAAESLAPVEAAPAAAEAQAAAEPEIYTVVKGDSLGAIAQKYYGRASAWKKIQQANMDVLRGKNKDVIRPGMKLTIPRP